MKAYKGFNKDLTCRGFQYEIGKEYTEEGASLCSKGFHACEYPLDCFSYYAPADSRFCEVEIEDNGQRNNDTKVCGDKIKIGAEIGIKGLIKAAFEYTRERCTNSEQGGDMAALTGGYMAALTGGYMAALTGGYMAALTGGDRAALTGGYMAALTGGNRAALTGGDMAALTGGDRAALTGGYMAALTGGNRAALTGGDMAALTGGDRAALTGGYFSVLLGGEGAKVKAGKGSVIALQYWFEDEFIEIKCAVVDGAKIKENVFYELDESGNFVECKESEE